MRAVAVRANVSYCRDLHVGPGSVVWAPNHLGIGRRVYVGKNVTLQFDGEVGDGVLFANGCGVVGRYDHDYTQVGHCIRDADWVGDHQRLSSPTYIGSDVWIGFNAVVQSGIKIGNSSIVAAGSVVTRDLPDNVIAAGVPAKVLRARFSAEEFDAHWEALVGAGISWSHLASSRDGVA
ncbi:MAG: acyltransferase [Rhodococcus sp.]|nr:acyltransferase [Rhodococcus sp. (in: high G+C Gram-positive bacteria)]MBJ7323339.1 acyltransferase [Rhodococcus sp. (in: high G+C Gram-positive bacteria)]